jgi:drug/metabolite transporter (DMT)-like permease
LSDRQRSFFFLVLTAILWSTSGLFVKIIPWQPLAILGMRGLFATLVFISYLRSMRIEWSFWLVVSALGQIATQFLFITATKQTTAANAIFLQYTTPIYVTLLGIWLLKEYPTRLDLGTMAVIFLGLTLFFVQEIDFRGTLGNILALLSGFTMAVMTIAMRKQPPHTTTQSVLLATLLMSVCCLPFSLQEEWTVPIFLGLAFLGIVQIGIAMLLYSNAIRKLKALEVTLITALEPILNPFWVFLVLGERPGPLSILGGILVVGAVVGNAYFSQNAKAKV